MLLDHHQEWEGVVVAVVDADEGCCYCYCRSYTAVAVPQMIMGLGKMLVVLVVVDEMTLRVVCNKRWARRIG